MRSRGWVVVTVVLLIGALLLAGVGAALLVSGGTPAGAPEPPASTPVPVTPGDFELRQVLFQECGGIQRKPPLRPGRRRAARTPPVTCCGSTATCSRVRSPPDDNVILCDSFGFRYGLGPSELPPDARRRAPSPLQGERSTTGWCR